MSRRRTGATERSQYTKEMTQQDIHVGPYFVALIDIVGQRDKLRAWKVPVRLQSVYDVIESAEYVKELRKQFNDVYELAAQSTGLLDQLDEEKRTWVEKRKQSRLWRRGFSDSYAMTVSCWDEQEWGLHAADIYYSLLGICAMFIWALARGKPFRGGADIGLGTEISEQEVYGPITVQAYELESRKAKWPRVMVGTGLLSYLDELEKRCGDDLDSRHTKLNIHNALDLITKTRGGKYMLDVMGDGVHSVFRDELFTEMIQVGYQFVTSEQKHFYKAGPKKIHYRYSQLRRYIESRLPIWGISCSHE